VDAAGTSAGCSRDALCSWTGSSRRCLCEMHPGPAALNQDVLLGQLRGSCSCALRRPGASRPRLPPLTDPRAPAPRAMQDAANRNCPAPPDRLQLHVGKSRARACPPPVASIARVWHAAMHRMSALWPSKVLYWVTSPSPSSCHTNTWMKGEGQAAGGQSGRGCADPHHLHHHHNNPRPRNHRTRKPPSPPCGSILQHKQSRCRACRPAQTARTSPRAAPGRAGSCRVADTKTTRGIIPGVV
jgi:hypothetical protein